ncbi:MAG: RidA family protein [Spirochaetia bacterium]|nr:RidA family protein [Spirochaetia bacterium]
MIDIIATKDAPSAIGPYSQAVKAGGFIFISGQIPIVPETGEIIEGGIIEQTEQVMLNIDTIIKAAGATLKNTVKTTIYIQNMNDFAQVNEIYSRFFSKHKPARATIEVSALPKNALVEIEAVLYIGP